MASWVLQPLGGSEQRTNLDLETLAIGRGLAIEPAPIILVLLARIEMSHSVPYPLTTRTSVRIIDTNNKNILSILSILSIDVSPRKRGEGKLKTVNSKLTTERQLGFVESVQSIIVDMTDNGRTIVKFLIAAVNGELPDFQPCHQLEAARLLKKYSGQEVKAIINNLDLPPATRRERRDARRADRRIHSELAQIVQEETDNGRTIVTFLVKAMDGELDGFQPCHRMSAAKELLHRGSQYEEVVHPEPVEGPEEEEERLRREEYERQREEATEFSLHGPVYYEIYPWPCPCEDRWHDCEGNELTDEEREQAARKPPGTIYILRSDDTLEAFKSRYEAYLTRLNPDPDKNPFSIIRWPNLDSYYDP